MRIIYLLGCHLTMIIIILSINVAHSQNERTEEDERMQRQLLGLWHRTNPELDDLYVYFSSSRNATTYKIDSAGNCENRIERGYQYQYGGVIDLDHPVISWAFIPYKIVHIDSASMHLTQEESDGKIKNHYFVKEPNDHPCAVLDKSERQLSALGFLLPLYLCFVFVSILILLRNIIKGKFIFNVLKRYLIITALLACNFYGSVYGIYRKGDSWTQQLFIDGELNGSFAPIPFRISSGEGDFTRSSGDFWFIIILALSFLTIPEAIWHAWRKQGNKKWWEKLARLFASGSITGLIVLNTLSSIFSSGHYDMNSWFLLLLSFYLYYRVIKMSFFSMGKEAYDSV